MTILYFFKITSFSSDSRLDSSNVIIINKNRLRFQIRFLRCRGVYFWKCKFWFNSKVLIFNPPWNFEKIICSSRVRGNSARFSFQFWWSMKSVTFLKYNLKTFENSKKSLSNNDNQIVIVFEKKFTFTIPFRLWRVWIILMDFIFNQARSRVLRSWLRGHFRDFRLYQFGVIIIDINI